MYQSSKQRKLIVILAIFTFINCILSIFSCSEYGQETNEYFGTSITNGIRRGRLVKNRTGMQYFYCYIISSITNDSLIPMHVRVGFPVGNYEPTPANGQTFKVFLQPDILSNSEVKKLLEGHYSPPVFDTILSPKEKIVLNIGFVTEFISPLNLNPIPFVLSSKGHFRGGVPSISNSLINKFVKEENRLTLLLDLNFLPREASDTIKRYSVIPCGEISF